MARNLTLVTARRRVKVKIVDEIIESLRQDIVMRRMPHGVRMPSERELADRFGVSQPTIREAIRSLETLGLVDVHHGSGSYIRGQGDYALAAALQTLLQLENVGIIDVLDVRQILGRQSVELAARYADASAIAAIEHAHAALEHVAEADDVDAVIERIANYQRAVSAAARNPLLHSLEVFMVALLLQVQVIALRRRGVRFWRQRAAEFHSDRGAILAGIVRRDPDEARAAIERYFDHQRARFMADQDLRGLSLSDPRLIPEVANLVRRFRASQTTD